jgi:hypothetical protein
MADDGFDSLGFDFGKLLQATGGVATYGVSAYEEEKKAKEDKATQSKNLSAVIAADQAAANAIAKAEFSAATMAPSAAIDAQAAQMAVATEDRAGAAGLSAESQKKRAEVAEGGLNAAVKAAQARPADKYLAALVKAWGLVVNKANSGAIMAAGQPGASGFDSYGSWWTRPAVGKLPGWGVVTIGVGLATAVGVVVKKMFFAKVVR